MVLRQLITMKTHGKIPVIMEVESGGFRSMKTLVLSLCVAGTTLMAAGLQNRTQLRGDYIEARTADVFTGPCFANAEVDRSEEHTSELQSQSNLVCRLLLEKKKKKKIK